MSSRGHKSGESRQGPSAMGDLGDTPAESLVTPPAFFSGGWRRRPGRMRGSGRPLPRTRLENRLEPRKPRFLTKAEPGLPTETSRATPRAHALSPESVLCACRQMWSPSALEKDNLLLVKGNLSFAIRRDAKTFGQGQTYGGRARA
jgi:hypothetical protein